MRNEEILDLVLRSYRDIGGVNLQDKAHFPSRDQIRTLLDGIRELLFPGFFGNETVDEERLAHLTAHRIDVLRSVLNESVRKVLYWASNKENESHILDITERFILAFFVEIPQLRLVLSEDAKAIFNGDPAAKSINEVKLSYPGFQAVLVHRVAHFFYRHDIPLLPRMMSELVHSETGIDIHPGATIGKGFCIDHGTGIVIGETALIGDYVKLYQGVTLGAFSVKKESGTGKRHPTLKDYVTVYAGSTILGGETVIGEHAVVGGNVWLVESLPPYAKVYLAPDDRHIRITP